MNKISSSEFLPSVIWAVVLCGFIIYFKVKAGEAWPDDDEARARRRAKLRREQPNNGRYPHR